MRSGGRRGRSRDGDASLAVRTRPRSPASSPAARSRSGARAAAALSVVRRATSVAEVARSGCATRAACGCRQAASPGPNSIRAQLPTTDARPRPARPHLVARTIGTDHGISRFGGELGRGGATRTDGLILKLVVSGAGAWWGPTARGWATVGSRAFFSLPSLSPAAALQRRPGCCVCCLQFLSWATGVRSLPRWFPCAIR